MWQMMLPQVTNNMPLISSKLGTFDGGAELLGAGVLVPPVLDGVGSVTEETGVSELDGAGVVPLAVGASESDVLVPEGLTITLSVSGSVSPHAAVRNTDNVSVQTLFRRAR